jgi:hypothetical protein
MNDYNGWKNETTWTINVFYMETIEKMLNDGLTHESIVEHIKFMLTGHSELSWVVP